MKMSAKKVLGLVLFSNTQIRFFMQEKGINNCKNSHKSFNWEFMAVIYNHFLLLAFLCPVRCFLNGFPGCLL